MKLQSGSTKADFLVMAYMMSSETSLLLVLLSLKRNLPEVGKLSEEVCHSALLYLSNLILHNCCIQFKGRGHVFSCSHMVICSHDWKGNCLHAGPKTLK